MTGDRVIAKVTRSGARNDPDRVTGKIIKILDRAHTDVVGTLRQEQDRSLDGSVDTWIVLSAKTGKEREVRRDSNGDGAVDSWRKNGPDGTTLKLEEDRSGDGKPDRIVTFKAGKPDRFEEDTNNIQAGHPGILR